MDDKVLSYQQLPNAPVPEADILFLPVPFEHTVCYKKGTSRAPEAILYASRQLEYYEEDEGWSPMLYMNVAVLAPVEMKKYENEAQFHKRLSAQVNGLPTNNLLIAIGGEHSITPSIVEARMPNKGTVVHLDAHADLRPKYCGSEYNHACSIFRVSQMGHSVISIGIRSMTEDEASYISKNHNLTIFTDRSLMKPQIWKRMIERLSQINGPVWLTIDMDVFNPDLVSGVGTPQPGGLDWYHVLEILETVIKNPYIAFKGMDIVELIPEPSLVSDMTGAKIIQKSISFWGKLHKFDLRQQRGAQTRIEYENL